MLRRAWKTRSGAAASIVLLLVLLLGVLGPFLAPYSPYDQVGEPMRFPGGGALLGTDYLGRDILSRLLVGSSLSVFSSLLVLVVSLIVGVIPALVSVYSGRVFEWASLRLMDTLIVLPFLVVAVAVTQLVGNGIVQAMIVVGVLIAPVFYRVTRSATIAVGTTPYVEAALLMGASTGHVIRAHVWRKVVPVIAIAGANVLAAGFIVISALTFLGIGVQPPYPTWGGMLAADLGYLAHNPLSPLFPAALIVITVVALNGLADALRDVSGEAGVRAQARRARKTPRGAARV